MTLSDWLSVGERSLCLFFGFTSSCKDENILCSEKSEALFIFAIFKYSWISESTVDVQEIFSLGWVCVLASLMPLILHVVLLWVGG